MNARESDGKKRDKRAGCVLQKCLLRLCCCLGAVCMCACHQKELVYPATTMINVTVSFDWAEAPTADPEGMTVVFFPIGDEGHIWRYELKGRDGGAIEIPVGNYRMLAYNNDTKHIQYDGISGFDSYNAYTSEISLAWPQSVTERFPEIESYKSFRSPDMLYCGTAYDVSVGLCSVSYRSHVSGTDPESTEIKECGKHIIKCYPSLRTSTYTCVFRNVLNIESMRRGYCLLTGLSPSDLIAADILSESEGAYPFSVHSSDTEISGSTIAFGRSSSQTVHQYLYLVVVLADGSVVSYCHDVSDQIMNSPDKRNVMIIIEGLELPDVNPVGPDDPATDFEVGVDDWEMIIINNIIV